MAECLSDQHFVAYYKAFSTTTSSSALVPRLSPSNLAGASDLDLPLVIVHKARASIAVTGSHVPSKSLILVHAAFRPDAAEASFKASPLLIPERPPVPVLTSSILFRRFIGGLPSLVSPDLTTLGSCPAFAATLTTNALDASSLQRLATSA